MVLDQRLMLNIDSSGVMDYRLDEMGGGGGCQ